MNENNHPDKAPASLTKSDFKAFFGHLLALIKHNWGWKVTCVLLAICLWGGMITQDSSLSRAKTISDITVNVLNQDTLLRSGFIVVSGLEEEVLSGVRIRVDVPQRYYDTVTAANYNVRVDLSRVRSAGEQVLPVIATSTSTYGTVTDISLDSITVMVEEYMPRSRIPVVIITTGEAPQGFYAEQPNVDPQLIEIAGPRSLVEKVVRCTVTYDMDDLSAAAGTMRTAVPFVLQDRQNNIIPLDNIDVSVGGVLIDSIAVEQKLYQTVSLPVSTAGITTGQPMAGYEIKSITTEPAAIDVAFTDKNASGLTHLYPAGTIDITGASEPVVASVVLSRPTNALYLSSGQVYVTVNIGAVE